ncbi:molybdenum cofactor guanylyltransferase [Microbacterium sp. C7(2022)]|uniref:molybdenum cofactor guanylyltransferase n=1 Tax=Microbacterium sp. C7(2022) TaxID=2992759 RepID=UPI00237A0C8F|nr:NTP transferase domain-containing protein [Microbacterium sp. C7(2022)]MDE0546070.1 NTP transferase domain-containing protein [Microbacterium sp. C7(2022)]
MPAPFGAILLAGGRATRMDGVAKPLLEVGGRTLLEAAASAVRDAGCHPITVVADVLDPTLDVSWVREDPPFGGPAAAIVAACNSWGEAANAPEWTFVLACDLPAAGRAVAMLREALPLLPSDADGVCLADPSGRPQWLTGLYRSTALAASAAALPDRGRNAPARALLDDLAITVLRADADMTHDIDTWEDLTSAREHARPRIAEETP